MQISPSGAAVGLGITKSFVATDAVGSVSWSVLPGGAGGVIDQNGFYSAPPEANDDPAKTTDTIQATDDNGSVTTTVLVCTPVQLVREILARELGLDDAHCYLWDQKIKSPTDFGLWIAIVEMNPYCIGNTVENEDPIDGIGINQAQVANFVTTLSIDICSRGPAARNKKEQVVMALMSTYSEMQQEANCFQIARNPSAFTNLSLIDGAAIPYRFNISVNVTYMVKKTSPSPYFDSFNSPQVFTDD